MKYQQSWGGLGPVLVPSVPDKVQGPFYLQRLLFHICFLWAESTSLLAQPQLLLEDWDQAEGRNLGRCSKVKRKEQNTAWINSLSDFQPFSWLRCKAPWQWPPWSRALALPQNGCWGEVCKPAVPQLYSCSVPGSLPGPGGCCRTCSGGFAPAGTVPRNGEWHQAAWDGAEECGCSGCCHHQPCAQSNHWIG